MQCYGKNPQVADGRLNPIPIGNDEPNTAGYRVMSDDRSGMRLGWLESITR